jgi:hypothetical protein
MGLQQGMKCVLFKFVIEVWISPVHAHPSNGMGDVHICYPDVIHQSSESRRSENCQVVFVACPCFVLSVLKSTLKSACSDHGPSWRPSAGWCWPR